MKNTESKINNCPTLALKAEIMIVRMNAHVSRAEICICNHEVLLTLGFRIGLRPCCTPKLRAGEDPGIWKGEFGYGDW